MPNSGLTSVPCMCVARDADPRFVSWLRSHESPACRALHCRQMSSWERCLKGRTPGSGLYSRNINVSSLEACREAMCRRGRPARRIKGAYRRAVRVPHRACSGCTKHAPAHARPRYDAVGRADLVALCFYDRKLGRAPAKGDTCQEAAAESSVTAVWAWSRSRAVFCPWGTTRLYAIAATC